MYDVGAASVAWLLFLASASAVKLGHQAREIVETSKYAWPSGRGFFGKFSGGATRAQAPFDLKASLNWTWHGNLSRYARVPNGANIDDHKGIYLTAFDGIRKFSPDGKLLWKSLDRDYGEEFPDQAALYKSALYVSTTFGRVMALDMRTGEKIWTTQLAGTDMTNGWVSVDEGIVITGSDIMTDLSEGKEGGVRSRIVYQDHKSENNVALYSDQLVTGLNATDGRVLWRFQPEAPVWNFHASFAGDGTFVFQDYEGRAYRCRVSDGTEVWRRGGVVGSWTDGSAILGPNRVVYTVNNHVQSGRDQPGDVTAWRLEDGQLLWIAEVPQPPNNIPAIGRLFGRAGLSLVQPAGQQGTKGAPTFVYALDAETGKLQWKFDGPSQKDSLQAGDSDKVASWERQNIDRVRPITAPNPWSAPSIDGSGTVFIGSEEGNFYALRDANSDGVVKGEAEVSSYDTKACFSGSMSPAISPGMVVAGSIDQLFVFKQ